MDPTLQKMISKRLKPAGKVGRLIAISTQRRKNELYDYFLSQSTEKWQKIPQEYLKKQRMTEKSVKKENKMITEEHAALMAAGFIANKAIESSTEPLCDAIGSLFTALVRLDPVVARSAAEQMMEQLNDEVLDKVRQGKNQEFLDIKDRIVNGIPAEALQDAKNALNEEEK